MRVTSCAIIRTFPPQRLHQFFTTRVICSHIRLARVVEMRCMPETPVRSPLEATEPQKGGMHRRVEEADEFSQVDFTQPDIRQALRGAYRVLLKYRSRRLSEEPEGR